MSNAQFTRPSVWDAKNPQQAYTEAHQYLTHILKRIQASNGGSAHRKSPNWGHAGDLQHAIDLAEQLLDAVR